MNTITSLTVISDTHGEKNDLADIISRRGMRGKFLFLGDGLRSFCTLADDAGIDYLAVHGNCDFGSSDFPAERITVCGECVILMLHSHTAHVKSGLEYLVEHAVEYDADAVLYGHTHVAQNLYLSPDALRDNFGIERQRGLYVINPGSFGEPREGAPSYAVIDIQTTDGRFKALSCNIAKIEY